MKYLHIDEDQNLSQTEDAPSQDDLDSIDAGILTILVFLGGEFKQVDCDGNYAKI